MERQFYGNFQTECQEKQVQNSELNDQGKLMTYICLPPGCLDSPFGTGTHNSTY